MEQTAGGWLVVLPRSDEFRPVHERVEIAGDFAVKRDGAAVFPDTGALSVACKVTFVDASVGILDDRLTVMSGSFCVHCFVRWCGLVTAFNSSATIYFNFLVVQCEIEIGAKNTGAILCHWAIWKRLLLPSDNLFPLYGGNPYI